MKEEKRYTLAIDSENLDKILIKKENELEGLIQDFQLNHVKYKLDKVGNQINDTNPLLVSTYFFKSINPMGNVDPIYTSDQLAKVYEMYSKIVEEVNMNIMLFQPTISHFCKFAGISLNAFQGLKNTYDENMRVLVERINADIFDSNMTLAQHKKVTERPTTYRMKVENEMIEKKSPTVNVNVNAKTLDLDKINERLYEIQNITKKQIKYEGK